MGAPRIISLHTILGPPDHFLRLLYEARQISFFSYNMGAPLRSVSLFTIWGPPQISFFACYRGGGGTTDFSFFTKDTWGPPQISFSAYYMGPLRLVYLLTIGGPLTSVSSHTIWGPPHIYFFAY